MRFVARAFRRIVLARPWAAFLMLCLSFVLFGAGTLNLLTMFKLNVLLIADNGVMALADGAARQLVELVSSLLLSMLAYIVFKACEHRLVHALSHADKEEAAP